MKLYVALLIGLAVLVTLLNLPSKTEKKEEKPTKEINVTLPVLPLEQEETTPVKKLKVRHLELSSEETITLFGEVSSESALMVINELKQKALGHDVLYIVIDSPGGSVLAGAQIISAMEGSGATVNTVCIGICASMAAMIFEYGKTRYSVNRSVLMFHPAAGGVQGNLNEMKSLLAFIDRYTKKMDAHVSSRAKIDEKIWENMVAHNVWVDGEDAIEKGLSDQLATLSTHFAPELGLSNYKKFPLFLFDMK